MTEPWPQYRKNSAPLSTGEVLARVAVVVVGVPLAAAVVLAGGAQQPVAAAPLQQVRLPTVVVTGKREWPDAGATAANVEATVKVVAPPAAR